MRWLFAVLLVGTLLATASRSNAVQTSCHQSSYKRPQLGVASATVGLSRPAGSRLIEGSDGEVQFVLQPSRRLRFTSVDLNIVSGNRNPYELTLVAGDVTLASAPANDACPLLVTKPLSGTLLAQLFGLRGAARPQVVLRDQGSTSPLLVGSPGEIHLARGGCATVCSPALTAACRTSCGGQQPPGRCVRQCRGAGLQACRETGSCRLE